MNTDETTAPLSQKNIADAENGGAKYTKEDEAIDLSPRGGIIGLTKEELERYRNDPFWRTLRIVSFVLFWLAWIAMFAGAILIVVLSPKCVSKKAPEWWRTQVSYQIFTPSFSDSDGNGVGDFKGIEGKLNDLRKIGVTNIWLTPVIKTHKDDFKTYDVVDHGMVDERFGTMEQFEELISEVHSAGLYLVMDLPISTTSTEHKWFQDAKKGGKFKNYYVWAKAADVKNDPNYVSVANSDEAYLAYKGHYPILNWKNQEVKSAMLEVAKKYIDKGVDGFHMAYVKHLKGDEATAAQAKAALGEVESITNALHEHIAGNRVLKHKELAVFCLMEDMEELQPSDTRPYNAASLEYVLDDSITKLDSSTCPDGAGRCLHNAISSSLEHFKAAKLPHGWQITNADVSRPQSRFGAATGNLMTFLQMTLPGAIDIYYGQELGLSDAVNSTSKTTGLMQWNPSSYAGFTSNTEQPFFTNTNDYKTLNFETQYKATKSPLKTFKTLAKLRQRDDTLVLGETHLTPFNTANELIIYTRIQHDGENSNKTRGAAYIVVANFAMHDASVEMAKLIPADRLASNVRVAASTSNHDTYRMSQQLDLSTQPLAIGPKQGILLKV